MSWCVGEKEINHTFNCSEMDGWGWSLKYGLYIALGPVSMGDFHPGEHWNLKKEFIDKIWCCSAPLFLILSIFNISWSHKNPVTPEENLHWVFLHLKKCPCPLIGILQGMREFTKWDSCLF